LLSNKIIERGLVIQDTTWVVSVPAQTIINFEANPSSASLISGTAMLSGLSILNGTAQVNNKIIERGLTVLNGTNVTDTSNSKLGVILDSADALPNTVLSPLKAISLVTGLNAGVNTIVPAARL